jgi:hypothetical protein
MAPGDAERTAVANRLRDAVGQGILPFEELDARLDAAYSAETIEALEQLVRWLPAPGGVPGPTVRARRWWPIAAVLFGAVSLGALIFTLTDPGQASSHHASPTRPPLSSAVPTSVPVLTGPKVSPATRVVTGTPTNGEVAVISVDAKGHRLTLETGLQDVEYATCSQFQAVSPTGTKLTLSGLAAGDYATPEIDATIPCLKQVRLVAAPEPPRCTISGLPGRVVVTWEGFNQSAHSVLYLATGPRESVTADRWCVNPTVVGVDDSATALSKIPVGADVQLLLSDDGGWVTSVTVLS